MLKKSQELAKKETELREKFQTLTGKDAATESELKEADGILTEIEQITAERKAAESREAFAEANNIALNELKNAPVNQLPHNGNVGFSEGKAGEVVIDRKTRQIIEDGGAISVKQLSDISTIAYRDAFRNYLSKGIQGIGPTDLKVLSVGTDSEGGFLVPADTIARMVERQAATPTLVDEVTTISTSSDRLVMPKNAYAGSTNDRYSTGVRVSWVDEKTGPSSEADASDFGNVTIPVHTAMMYHDLTKNLIEDSAFNISSWLANKFGETAMLTKEDMIINGTGLGQPKGLLANPGGTNEPATVVSGNGTAVLADGLIDLKYALLGRYQRNAKWVFNSTSTEKAIAKLKDSQNRYIFSDGAPNDALATARPAVLLGKPIISNDFMPDVAANAFPIIFGDLTGYYFVNRVAFSIQVLNEIVATANKVRLLGRLRVGGQVAEDWKLKIQKIST